MIKYSVVNRELYTFVSQNEKIMKEKITLWRNNQTSGEYQLTLPEVKEKFVAYCKTKDLAWLDYYGTDAAVRSFIGDKEYGLSSVMEIDDYAPLANYLKPFYYETINEIKHPHI